jgi:glycosyltransferase involved in cell wall biosynthesis
VSSSVRKHADQTIGLCMIVRNEEAVLERCLQSVLGLVDSWVICDTGSTDGTRELARAVLGDLPGTLYERPWVDFGHNRSELMQLAEGTADYLLLLDADMTVQQRAPLPDLSAAAYLLRETGQLDFAVARLVRGDRSWRYEGSTHEYIATSGGFRQEQLDELLIEHRADGSSRGEKLLRDVALLKRDLARDPDNVRSVFYLAQTFRDLGKRELAIHYYRRRVELGGWDEEVFYANLQEGILRAQVDLDSAVPVLLEAWERRPTRAEPLYQLAHAYRLRGELALAHLFASRGLEIPYPTDVLFIHRNVYEWGLRLERALAASGLGRTDEARADLLQLLREADLPREIEHRVAGSLVEVGEREQERPSLAARRNPRRLASLAPSTRIGEIELDVSPPWPSFNPSIARDGNGFRMIVRTANYEIERGVLHADGILQNINYLVALDGDLVVRAIDPIVDRSSGVKRYPARVQGYEDCRLVNVAGRWYATATAAELNPAERRQMVLLTLDGADITSVKPLPGPREDVHEKNWMPMAVDGDLHIVYSCGPTILLRCDVESGTIEQVSERPAPDLARGFRGGSQGVLLEQGGHLFVVHEVDRSERAAQYLHRFVLLDERFALAAISRPFTFAAERVEFCAGMALRGGDLVLSFGVSDAAAGLAVVALGEVLGLLDSLDVADRVDRVTTT